MSYDDHDDDDLDPDPRRPEPRYVYSLADMPQRLRRKVFSIAIHWRISANETFNYLREMALMDVDPRPAGGERFVFTRPETVTADYFSAAEVPQDTDNVDIFEGEAVAEQDIRAGAELRRLGQKLTWEQCSDIIRNQYRWARFLAVRHWDPEERLGWAQLAHKADAMLDRLAEKNAAYIAKHYPEYNREAEATDAEGQPWPQSSALLGVAGAPEAQAVRSQRLRREAKSKIRVVKGGN